MSDVDQPCPDPDSETPEPSTNTDCSIVNNDEAAETTTQTSTELDAKSILTSILSPEPRSKPESTDAETSGTGDVCATLPTSSGLIKCPSFCRTNCIIQHHPLLVAILNCVDTEEMELMDMKLGILQSVIKKYKQSTLKWQCDYVVPDVLPKYQYPMIHWACMLGRVGAAVWLIGHKYSSPTARAMAHNADTGLHMALRCLQETSPLYPGMKFLQLLSVMEPALSVQDQDGNTPIHLCCLMLRDNMPRTDFYQGCLLQMVLELSKVRRRDEVAKVLNLKNDEGQTAIDFLYEFGKAEPQINFLTSYGATPKSTQQTEEERRARDGYCLFCSKQFSTKVAFDNHCQSRKHKENETIYKLQQDAPIGGPEDSKQLFHVEVGKMSALPSKGFKFSFNDVVHTKTDSSSNSSREGSISSRSTPELDDPPTDLVVPESVPSPPAAVPKVVTEFPGTYAKANLGSKKTSVVRSNATKTTSMAPVPEHPKKLIKLEKDLATSLLEAKEYSVIRNLGKEDSVSLKVEGGNVVDVGSAAVKDAVLTESSRSKSPLPPIQLVEKPTSEDMAVQQFFEEVIREGEKREKPEALAFSEEEYTELINTGNFSTIALHLQTLIKHSHSTKAEARIKELATFPNEIQRQVIEALIQRRNTALQQLRYANKGVDRLQRKFRDSQKQQDTLVSEIMIIVENLGQLQQEEQVINKDLGSFDTKCDNVAITHKHLKERLANCEEAMKVLKRLHKESKLAKKKSKS